VLPLRLKIYQNLKEFGELERLWERLLMQYPAASVFCTWEWLASWWNNFGNHRTLLVLAFFDSDSQLAAVAPLSIGAEPVFGRFRLRVLRFMGDGSGDSDNLDFPVRPGFEDVFVSEVLKFLQENSGRWDIAQLNTMPMESLVSVSLMRSLQSPRWLYFQHFCSSSRVLLPPTWDDYLARISSKQRRNLGYYRRKLQNSYSVRIYRCLDESELRKCLDALFRLHQNRWQTVGQPGSFAGHSRRQFYTELSQRLLATNKLDLWIAELDGKIVAVQFAMRYGDTVYSLQEAYDPAHSADRAGLILRGEVLKNLISEGIRVYDFLAGDDPHKALWSVTPGCYRDVHFAATWSKGGAVLNCIHHGTMAKELLRARLHPSIWRALRQASWALRPQKRPTP
jgi:CelD/BcsL family acetyltransferase involved in cellulose biosynthesis